MSRTAAMERGTEESPQSGAGCRVGAAVRGGVDLGTVLDDMAGGPGRFGIGGNRVLALEMKVALDPEAERAPEGLTVPPG